jgi:peptidoglycan/LPS O-acetylase OafA/YrhL
MGGVTLREAFSLRRNLRALFVPPAGHLRPLDGLRALSILWVILFHAGFYSIWYVPTLEYARLLLSPWMLVLWRGDFGVDVFFVLSGFLVAGMVLDERAKTGRVRLGLFQVRRFLRTWPALFVALLVNLSLFGDNPDVAWANLLYVSNFVTVAHVCMGWTWSLSIEEQFYVLCPWLLRGVSPLPTAGRLLVLVSLATACALFTAYVVAERGYHPFDADIVINRPLDRWIPAFDDLYTKPWMRAGPLLAGVGSAIAYRDPLVAAWWSRARVAAPVGFALALAALVLATHWPLFETAPRALQVAYLATFRPVFGLAVAFVMLFSLSAHPIGRWIGRLLSVRVLYPVGQLAYSAYLVNPMVTTLVDRSLAGWVAVRALSPMLVFLPLDLLGTLVAAAGLHLLVERPLLWLRPRSGAARGTS